MWSYNQSESSDSELSDDIQFALAHLTQQLQNDNSALAAFFNPDDALIAARAPGRLDVMGGIADYSGSTVLQLPLAESTVVFCQFTVEPVVRIISAIADSQQDYRSVCWPISIFVDETTGRPASLPQMKNRFQALPADQQWAAYIAGVIPVLMDSTEFRLDTGIVFYVCSTVPEGKGVSSSAAIEVAAMRALTRAGNFNLGAHQQAILCQRVENNVVGAPCGLMDQMTCSVGRKNTLLRLLCQPDIVQSSVQLPPGLAVWGIDSGERHAVSGSDYESVRVAAFIGYRLMLESAGVAGAHVKASRIVDDRWDGYLANVSVSEFVNSYEALLPKSISGAQFLERFDRTTDSITEVKPSVDYAVRVCTAHPIHEHFRAQLFAQLAMCCEGEQSLIASAQLMGEFMYQSHAGYTSCGIGSPGTDSLVARVRQAGSANGLYGARITGGGSGGTVAILAQVGCDKLIRSIAAAHAADTGIGGQVFSGSSNGASDLVLQPM